MDKVDKDRTTLMLPSPLAAGLDDLLPFAKHKKYIGRSDVRNDLIRYLLERGVESLRAELAAETAPRRKK